jgi:hypothetical protein
MEDQVGVAGDGQAGLFELALVCEGGTHGCLGMQQGWGREDAQKQCYVALDELRALHDLVSSY